MGFLVGGSCALTAGVKGLLVVPVSVSSSSRSASCITSTLISSTASTVLRVVRVVIIIRMLLTVSVLVVIVSTMSMLLLAICATSVGIISIIATMRGLRDLGLRLIIPGTNGTRCRNASSNSSRMMTSGGSRIIPIHRRRHFRELVVVALVRPGHDGTLHPSSPLAAQMEHDPDRHQCQDHYCDNRNNHNNKRLWLTLALGFAFVSRRSSGARSGT